MRFLYVSILLSLSTHTVLSQNPETVVQLGHNDAITCQAFTPNGLHLITGAKDNMAKIWDTRQGLLLRTQAGHKEGITGISIHKNGEWAATASEDNSLRVWKIFDGKLMYSLREAQDISDVAFSPDGNKLAYSTDKQIKLIEAATGKLIRILTSSQNAVKCLAFSPDGTKLAAAESDYSGSVIQLWNVTSGLKGTTLQGHKYGISQIVFSPDGKQLTYVGSDGLRFGQIQSYGLNNGKSLFLRTDSLAFWSVAYSPSGRQLAYGGFGKKVILIDTAGRPLGQADLSEAGALSHIAYAPDGQMLSCAAGWKTLLLNPNNLSLLKEYTTRTDYIWSLSLSPDGHQLAAACGNLYGSQSLKLWDLKQGKLIKSYQGHKDRILSVAISPNGKYLGSGSADASTAYWEMPNAGGTNLYRVVSGSTQISYARINAVAFHPRGNYLAGVGQDGKINYMRVGKGSVAQMQSDAGGLASVVFHPDGSQLAVGTHNGTFEIWNTDTKTQIQKINAHQYSYNVLDSAEVIAYGTIMSMQSFSVLALAYSPDGRYLVTAGGKEVLLWDTQTWSKIKRLCIHPGITSLQFSASGNYLVTGGADAIVNVWEVSTGKCLARLAGHQHEVRSVLFSKDEKYIFSGSLDTQIKLWDWKNAKESLSLMALSGSEEYLAVTPDGYYSASRKAVQALAFKVGKKIFPFEQFDLRFHRPDLVLKEISKIAYADPTQNPNAPLIQSLYAAWQKRLKKMGFTEDQLGKEFQLPEVKILTTDLPRITPLAKINITLNASDPASPIDRILVYVNDIPVMGKNGLSVKNPALTNLQKTLEIPLISGLNRVRITVMNTKGVESLSQGFELNRLISEVSKPDLYLIALGVSEYENKQMNLNYASKDARDLMQLYLSKAGDYRKIYVDSLLDRQATLPNILSLRTKLMQSKPEDHVVFFIAGHGLLDAQLDYYLATHPVDFMNPSSGGLSYTQLEELLDGIPAHHKLILLDACHSGEVDKEEMQLTLQQNTEQGEVAFRSVPGIGVKQVGLENSFELMKELFTDLRKSNGATVVSSAGGGQYALEGKEWKNGVFTYCLLQGLKNQEADINKDGKIMLSELQAYLQKQVYELTQGKQKPTSRAEVGSKDWQIW